MIRIKVASSETQGKDEMKRGGELATEHHDAGDALRPGCPPLSGPVVVLKSFNVKQPLEDEAEKKQKSNAFSVGASGTA